MLTFIHTHINISSTTKSGATIWNGEEKLCSLVFTITDAAAAFSCHCCSTASLTRVAGKVAACWLCTRLFHFPRICHRKPTKSSPLSPHTSILVHDLVHGRLFVPGSRHDIFVIGGDVAAENARRLVGLEDGGSVGRPP